MPIPNTKAAVFFAYDIMINGNVVGTLTRFSPNASKRVERVREISTRAGGRALEMIPGTTDISIDVEKLRLYKESLFNALGFPIYSIEDLNSPFDITETLTDPEGIREHTIYHSCLLSSYSRAVSTGNTLIAETATIQVAYISGFSE